MFLAFLSWGVLKNESSAPVPDPSSWPLYQLLQKLVRRLFLTVFVGIQENSLS